jgi:hypothetical protein
LAEGPRGRGGQRSGGGEARCQFSAKRRLMQSAKPGPDSAFSAGPIGALIGPLKTSSRSLKKQQKFIHTGSDSGWRAPVESAIEINAGFAGFLALV